MATLIDAVKLPREMREFEDQEDHSGNSSAGNKYLPVLIGSLPSASGYYFSRPLFYVHLLECIKDLLNKNQEDQINSNSSIDKNNIYLQLTPALPAYGLLISNARARNNKYHTKTIDILQNTEQCIETKNNYQIRATVRFEQQYERRAIHLIQLLILTSLICLHNASSCASFSMPDNSDNIGVSRNDNYYRNHLIIDQLNLQLPNRWKRGLNQHMQRSFFDTIDQMNPHGDLSSIFGSFSQDGPSSGPPGNGAQQTWTSIFGGGSSSSSTSNNNNNNNNNAGGGDALDIHVKNILIPRVSGTPGNIKVRQYIVDAMRKNDYQVELDEFTGATPIGNVKFANIIASSNPGACRQLVLACHYDSKLQEGFLGATDSAVPCAMLLRIAEMHNNSFSDKERDLGLRFIFFDGEEAFVQWTATDSLYGSRHLAAKWAKQQAPTECQSKAKNELERVELFVLLDLIGASDTTFVMYNTQLAHHYVSLQKYERAFLVKTGLTQVQATRQAAFKGRTMRLDFVEDDHVPFKKRGVPILLLLAHPFPRVWHTNADNYDSIDWPKTRRILHVMEQFVSNYPNNHNST